jgi:hypothetical protein
MDAEERGLLEKTLKLTEENNRLIHKVRGVQKRQAFWSVLKILVILGIALGAFYYLEPYLDKLMNVFNSIPGLKQNLDSDSLQEMLKNLKP